MICRPIKNGKTERDKHSSPRPEDYELADVPVAKRHCILEASSGELVASSDFGLKWAGVNLEGHSMCKAQYDLSAGFV